MEMTPQDIALFDAYLGDTLSATERASFAKRLSAEPLLAAALDEHQLMLQAVKTSGRAELKASLTELTTQIPDSKVKKYRPSNSGGFMHFFKRLFLGVLMAGLGFLAMDRLSLQETAPAPVQIGESEDYQLPLAKNKRAGQQTKQAKKSAKTSVTDTTQVDTIYKSITVSGDDKEMNQTIEAELRALKEKNPDSEIIIEDKRDFHIGE